MSVEIFQNGVLTPQQVLVGCLNDELENLDAVAVGRIFKDGTILWSWSDTNTAKLALMGVLLNAQVVDKARE